MMARRRRKRRRKQQQKRNAKAAGRGGLRTQVASRSQQEQTAGFVFHPSTRRLRQATLLAVQRLRGNSYVQRILGQAHFASRLQRQEEEDGSERAANPGGRGPGQIQQGSEQFYTVSGATLDAITDQLAHFDGFAAKTSADLGMEGRVTPQRLDDGTFRVQVTWIIPEVVVHLPRWQGYDAACAAAQQEWDRFMQQTRQHEQTAHVNAAHNFVEDLGEEDTVISGATIAELQRNLQAKRDELGERLQAIHDRCDHGASIDAILHPDNGRCPE